MTNTSKIALLLGGDLGDTAKIFDQAANGLTAGGVTGLRRSRLYRSRPVDCVPGTPDFLNQAVVGVWHADAEALLELTRRLESDAGRPLRHSSREARVLDCDIILFGNEIRHDPRLTLPHPRAARRLFVLRPLAEVAPDWIFPDTGLTVTAALAGLNPGDDDVVPMENLSGDKE